jgi:hypothetical protein
METYGKISTVLALCGLAACAHTPLGSSDQGVTSPVLNWAAVTTNETGGHLSGPVTYNVYAVQGTGPIPTTPSGSCDVTEVAKGPPLNTEPIATTTYTANVPDGVWTFAVEAISPTGCRSGLSSSVTITVLNRGGSLTSVTVGP